MAKRKSYPRTSARRVQCWIYLLALLLSVSSRGILGQVPANAGDGDDGVPTIDASQLDTVLTIDEPWRFHRGGEPAYTRKKVAKNGPGFSEPSYEDPAFDDSAWTAIAPGATYASAGLPDMTGGESWARLHLRVVNANSALGISLLTTGYRYTVYVNGQPLDSAPASDGPTAEVKGRQTVLPFKIPLHQTDDLVVAIHFVAPEHSVGRHFPLSRVQLGHSDALAYANQIQRMRDFNSQSLGGVVAGFILLAFVPVALTLFLLQRTHLEYVWLTIFCLSSSVYMFLSTADDAGTLKESFGHMALLLYAGWTSMIFSMEFIAAFAGIRQKRPIRILGGIMLVFPLLYLTGNLSIYALALLCSVFFWLAAIGIYLVSAYRAGHSDSALMLIPFAFIAVATLMNLLSSLFPESGFLPPGFHVGYLGLSVNNIGMLIFISSMLAVVLYRFVRISMDAERKAAQSEAAQAIQKVLASIPTVTPVPANPGPQIADPAYEPVEVLLQPTERNFFQMQPPKR